MKIKQKTFRLSVITLAAVSATAHAQTTTLKETIVTATRFEQNLQDVIADVTIIDRNMLDKETGASVSNVLAKHAGLQTISYGDISRVFTRGTDNDKTVLYVDGVRMDSHNGYTTTNGGAYWDAIPLALIERIEVVRGPASAVYGADAMGGVVQIFTRRADKPFAPFAGVEVGSLQTKKMHAGLTGMSQGWDYALTVSHDASNGFNTQPQWTHDPQTEGYNQHAGSVTLGYRFNQQHRVELSTTESLQHGRYIPYGGGTDYSTRTRVSNAALKWQAAWNESMSTKFSFSSGSTAASDTQGYDHKTTIETTAIDHQWRMKGGVLNLVAEHRTDRFDGYSPYDITNVSGRSRTLDGLGAGYGKTIGDHVVQINLRHDKDSLFGPKDTGSVGYAYHLTPTWKATASYATGFKAPTLYALYGYYGDINLKPETNHNTEAGVSYDNRGTQFKAVVYKNNLTNLISTRPYVVGDPKSFFYYNVGKATLEGVTLSGRTRLDAFTVFGSYDWLDARDEIKQTRLNLRANHSANLGAETMFAGWNVGADLRLVGLRYDDAANTKKLGGYGTVNLSAQKPFQRDWSVTARMENVGNKHYDQVQTYATPGRLFFVGLKWEPKY